ncbi:MAG: hypothetical protein O2909_04800 [Chloroflexi bacterium]|nr:hypothetical protein [Chloroflexota bacterium]MDA1218742.1 hypothetical protein [Chloroflexota bacterium]PKB58040.1 MAG: hypothetical protein BZY73_00130 [SAR202 cluster bacterium Casp-Chloro-G3]
MQKAQRDRILAGLSQEDRQNFRKVLTEIKTQMKATSSQRIPARQVLETCGDELTGELRAALEIVVSRDEMGPKIGETPPDFNLKRMGSEERVRLSSFRGKSPVALVFGSYT